MGNFYERYEQKVYILKESSYGTPTDGSQWTAISADYPLLRRLNVIPEGVDIPIPRILKQKLFDIDAAKHASHIANTNQDPVTFSMEMEVIRPHLLSYIFGESATVTHNTAEVTDITCTAKSEIDDDTYFFIYGIDGDGDIVKYRVIIDTSGSESLSDIDGHTDIVVDISDAEVTSADDVGGELATALDAKDEFSAANVSGVVTVTNNDGSDDVNGSVPDARDSDASSTGFTFEVTTQGVSTFSYSEAVGTDAQSFTLHCEQPHPTDDSYDIVYDLFGCVIEEYTLNINRDNGTISESVTIRSPHYAVGNKSTNPPERDTGDLYVWADLDEASDEYIIQEGYSGSTDKTPDSVNGVSFTVRNNPQSLPDVSKRYMNDVIFKRREVEFGITGFITDSDLFDYWREVWDTDNQRPDSASAKLNSQIELYKSSDRYIKIKVYNWLVNEHTCHFASIDEGIKGVDLTFTDAIPYNGGTNDRKIFVDGSDGSNGVEIKTTLSEVEMA